MCIYIYIHNCMCNYKTVLSASNRLVRVIGTLSNLATNLEDLGEQLGRSPTSKSWPPWAVVIQRCTPRPITRIHGTVCPSGER